MLTTLRTAQYNNRNCCYVISPINSSTTRPRPRPTRAAQRTEQFTTRRLTTTTGMQSRAEPGGSCISWFAGYEAQKENQNREFSRSRPRMHRQAQHCNHPPHSVGLQLSPFLLTFSPPLLWPSSLPHTEPFVAVIIATGIDNWTVFGDHHYQKCSCFCPCSCSLAR